MIDLGGAVVRTLSRSVTREQLRTRAEYYSLRVASTVVSLPGKQGRIDAELMAMKIDPPIKTSQDLLSCPKSPTRRAAHPIGVTGFCQLIIREHRSALAVRQFLI